MKVHHHHGVRLRWVADDPGYVHAAAVTVPARGGSASTPGWARTTDRRIWNPLRYQLRHRSVATRYPAGTESRNPKGR